jgi:hypothetical protein
MTLLLTALIPSLVVLYYHENNIECKYVAVIA